MLLQVHDELIFEVKKESATKYEKEIAQIMSGVLKLKVPIIVDGAIGQNWGEL
jgi:DNA polymerase I